MLMREDPLKVVFPAPVWERLLERCASTSLGSRIIPVGLEFFSPPPPIFLQDFEKHVKSHDMSTQPVDVKQLLQKLPRPGAGGESRFLVLCWAETRVAFAFRVGRNSLLGAFRAKWGWQIQMWTRWVFWRRENLGGRFVHPVSVLVGTLVFGDRKQRVCSLCSKARLFPSVQFRKRLTRELALSCTCLVSLARDWEIEGTESKWIIQCPCVSTWRWLGGRGERLGKSERNIPGSRNNCPLLCSASQKSQVAQVECRGGGVTLWRITLYVSDVDVFLGVRGWVVCVCVCACKSM